MFNFLTTLMLARDQDEPESWMKLLPFLILIGLSALSGIFKKKQEKDQKRKEQERRQQQSSQTRRQTPAGTREPARPRPRSTQPQPSQTAHTQQRQERPRPAQTAQRPQRPRPIQVRTGSEQPRPQRSTRPVPAEVSRPAPRKIQQPAKPARSGQKKRQKNGIAAEAERLKEITEARDAAAKPSEASVNLQKRLENKPPLVRAVILSEIINRPLSLRDSDQNLF